MFALGRIDLLTTFEVMAILQQDLVRLQRLDVDSLPPATLRWLQAHSDSQQLALHELEVRWKDAAN